MFGHITVVMTHSPFIDVGQRTGSRGPGLSFLAMEKDHLYDEVPHVFGDSVLPKTSTIFEFEAQGEVDAPTSENSPTSPRLKWQGENSYSLLPTSDFSRLSLLLKDYLFGNFSGEKEYLLDKREMLVLKYLLKKKFCYSHRADFSSKVDLVCSENVVNFLRRHPQKKRTQLFKRMVFTKFWKSKLASGVNILDSFFGGKKEFDYREPANNSGGNPTSKYYRCCFEVESFREEFLKTCESEEFWNFCKVKAQKSFDSNFQKWMEMIDRFLSSEESIEIERKMLMKIKFMSLDADSKRISSLFGL